MGLSSTGPALLKVGMSPCAGQLSWEIPDFWCKLHGAAWPLGL